ncbi:tetratricopeptide repeat protein [Undibacterium sp. TS12]|uniref:tetratricopeptide repeat protein n=1 Tax=Undibacterium sp. TS12 TaxID=2908202 RepID=UPI001F4D21D6|nr:tetratricopeptide repeat protein [Undibacterium sp. TS12]MCH8619489.1 tetratricopeptide repeat protein [Undibacterium sp. TS12]
MLSWFKKQFFSADQNKAANKKNEQDGDLADGAVKTVQELGPEQLGDASFKDGNLPAAIKYFQLAIEDKSADATLNNKLGDVFYEQQDFVQAEVQYRRALVIQPNFFDAEINLGLCLDAMGRFQEALVCYEHVIQNQPNNHIAFYNFAVTQTSLGNVTEAQSAYLKAISIKPDFSHAHFNLAVLFQRQGKLVDAEAHYLQTLSVNPAHFLAYCNLGILHLEKQEYLVAREKLLQSLSINPQHVETIYNLGKVAFALGQTDAAVDYFKQALKLRPDYIDAIVSLGNAYNKLHLLQEAESSYRQAIHFRPEHPAAYCNLGALLHEQKKYQEAIIVYTQGMANNAQSVLLYNNLGNTYSSINRLSEAEVCYNQALQIGSKDLDKDAGMVGLVSSDQAPTYSNLGLLHLEKGDFILARENFLLSLESNPEHVETIYNLGLIALKLEEMDVALAYFKQALGLRPDFAEAMIGLGSIYTKQKMLKEAEAVYRRVITLQPTNPAAYCNLGVLLFEQKQYNMAIEIYEQGIANNATSVMLYNNLGTAHCSANRFEEAEACFAKALQMGSEVTKVYTNLAGLLAGQGKFEEAANKNLHAVNLAPDYAQTYSNLLFMLNYDPDRSAEDIFAAYQEYERRYALRYKDDQLPFKNDLTRQRRLKIGYVSPDFCRHPVQYFLEPLMSHHNKALVEVYAYAQLSAQDNVTERYKGYADHWVETNGLSDDMLCQRIRNDGIDILIDLAGHTANNRLSVFARRPAPVQVSWLGFAYTTGLTAITYFLADEMSAPPGTDHLFAEQVWRLNTPLIVYRPAEGMGEVNQLPALTANCIRIGTLTRSIRVNYKTIRAWAAILKRVENAVLVVDSANYQDVALRQALIDKFAAHGIDESRLDIGYHSPPWDVLRSLDIGLDCFPHNSGTTLFETLYMGVPYVTLAGRPGVGRLGGSILAGAGHPEWIATTEEEYVDKVVTMAQDIPRLAEIRSTLRREMQNSPLMNESGFTQEVESAYRSMWNKWCDAPA